MASTSTLPSNDLMSPPKSGRFQLMVQAVAKSDQDAETIYSMAKAIQKRATTSSIEPKTIQYRVLRSADDQKTILIFEEYEEADALLKTHMEGEEFKALLAKLEGLTETLNIRFYKE